MSSSRTRISLSFLIVACALASAASAGAGNWRNYADPSLIMAIDQHEAEIYLATSGGLLIFDPLDSTFVVQLTNADGISSNMLTSITIAANGEIYLGTEGAGITRLTLGPAETRAIRLNAAVHGLADDRITSLTSWGDSIAYGSRGGVGVIYRGFPLAHYSHLNGLPDDDVRAVLADSDILWVATAQGVAVVLRMGFVKPISTGLPELDTYALARCDTTVWVATAGGVAQLDAGDSTWYYIGPAAERFFCLHYDGVYLWAGSDDGIHRYDGSAWTSYSVRKYYIKYLLSLARSQVRTLYYHPGLGLLVGLGDPSVERRGCNLVSFDGDSSWSNCVPNAPPLNDVIRADVDVDGSLWVATTAFGVGKLTPAGNWVNYSPITTGGESLSTRWVNNALLADRRGTKWIGAISYHPQSPLDELHDGLDEDFGNDIWIRHPLRSGGGDGLGTLRFIKAREDPAGNRWFLSDAFYKDDPLKQWGISILSEDTTAWLTVDPLSTGGGMAEGDVFDVAFGPGGTVYVALKQYGVQVWLTGGYERSALFDLADDTWFTLARLGSELAPTAEVNCLALRSDGVLWIGTSDGLYKYDRGEFSRIGADRGLGYGLLSALVKDLTLDQEENLWIGTDLGLNMIPRDGEGSIRSYTTSSAWSGGLSDYFPQSVISPLVNENVNDLVFDGDRGLLYIATKGGVSALDVPAELGEAIGLSGAFLYPNPIRAYRGDRFLRVANVSLPVTVEVYNLEGQLVGKREVRKPDDDAWDLTTAEGFFAASGVYIVKIKGESGQVVRAVSLLR